MRFQDVAPSKDFFKVKEAIPAMGMAAPGAAAPANPAMAQQPQPGQLTQAGQPPGGLDPKTAALEKQKIDREKEQLRLQIQQTQKQLEDMRKRLAELG